MKTFASILSCVFLASQVSGVLLTVDKVEWASRSKALCKSTDEFYEYTRVATKTGVTSANTCISSCVSSRNVNTNEECRFVQFASSTCTMHFYSDKSVSNRKVGCTHSSALAYIPRFKLTVKFGAYMVAGNKADLDKRYNDLKAGLKAAVLATSLTTPSSSLKKAVRGWWGTENNKCINRKTDPRRGSTVAVIEDHRKRSGPEYQVTTTVAWNFNGVFLQKGKANKGGNGLLYGYENFVKPLVDAYTKTTEVHTNHRVDNSIALVEGTTCSLGGCFNNGRMSYLTRSDQDTMKAPGNMLASFYDLATETNPILLASLSISNIPLEQTAGDVDSTSPFCNLVTQAGKASSYLTSAQFTALSKLGIAFGTAVSTAIGLVGAGVIVYGFVCALTGGQFGSVTFNAGVPLAREGSAFDTMLALASSGSKNHTANREAFCNFQKESGDLSADEEWCNKVVYKVDSWFEGLSTEQLLTRMDPACATLDGLSIPDMSRSAPPAALANLTDALRSCQLSQQARESEIASATRTASIGVASAALALVLLLAFAALRVSRKRRAAAATDIASKTDLTAAL